MGQPSRTAAQAAQDRNKDRTGRFQHAQSQESTAVELEAPSEADRLREAMDPTRTFQALAHDMKYLATKACLGKVAAHIRKKHPDAASLNYKFDTDPVHGLSADFESVTDALGNVLPVDEQMFAQNGHGGYAYMMDPEFLQEQLEWPENTRGEQIHRYELDEDSPDYNPDYTATQYARRLRLMQADLGRRAAEAETVAQVQQLHAQNPDVSEVTVGMSVTGRPIYTAIVRNGKKFQSPDVTGDAQDGSGFDWDKWSSMLSAQSDYSSIIGKPISTEAATDWVPGTAIE